MEPEDTDDEAREDLRDLIAGGMGRYVGWPHIDGHFVQLFHTLPGSSITDRTGDDDEQ